MNNKNIESAILLFLVGDMVGYGNGITEFNENFIFSKENYPNDYLSLAADYSNSLVFTFLFNNGFSDYPLPDFVVSDDTVMLIANAIAIIKYYKNKEKNNLINITKNEYISIVDNSMNNFVSVRNAGNTTIKYMKKLRDGDNYELFSYDERAGGNGGCMRSAIYGTVFWKQEDLLVLLETTINSTRLTHPNVIAILGSVAIALFASYAMNKRDINMWSLDLIYLLETTVIDNIFKKFGPEMMAFYKRDKKIFLDKWYEYREEKFSDNLKYKRTRIQKFPSERTKFYQKFSSRTNDVYPGAGGDDATIIAYDCLVEAEGSWEKVVIYSMLHVGDSDTTGAICAYLHGLVYGTSTIAQLMIDNIKDKEYLDKAKYVINEIKKIVK